MIVYYITAHGLGHAVRSCEVIRRLPPQLPLTICSGVDPTFFAQELPGRAFELRPVEYDCGVLGPDSSAVDLVQTFQAVERIERLNAQRLDAEAGWLRSVGARVVVCDATPFALRAARAAGIPSVLITNFSWTAIYQHLLDHYAQDETQRAWGQAIVDELQRDYDQGDQLWVPGMDVEFQACARRRNVPLIARPGRGLRPALIRDMELDPARPVFLIYLGREGLGGMQWERLEELGGVQFVSFSPPPGSEDLVREVPAHFSHGDVAHSVDGVVAKAGYGVCSECIAARVPLFYPPRPAFVEFQALHRELQAWGGAVMIPQQDFVALRWAPWLEQAGPLRARMRPVATGGGAVCAGLLEKLWQGTINPKAA